jgi:hypothetical protein
LQVKNLAERSALSNSVRIFAHFDRLQPRRARKFPLGEPFAAQSRVFTGLLDLCNTGGHSSSWSFGHAKPIRLFPNQTKDFVQKTIFADCDCMILCAANRTKMFHVKHFCPIKPRNQTTIAKGHLSKDLPGPHPHPERKDARHATEAGGRRGAEQVVASFLLC